MAQLPPKFPSMAQNWPSSFPFQMMPLSSTSTITNSQQNSWVDEFLDFSAARRSSHRRLVSDPIAFVEAPYLEECRNSNGTLMLSNNNEFERLDDEQVGYMFSDDVAAPGGSTRSSSNPSSANPSTPSDQNSDQDDEKTQPHDPQHVHVQPKKEPGEVDSSCKPHMQMQNENPTKPATNVSGDTIVDPKRIKRILANRQSAQRSRVRKLQYVSELERTVTTLQNEVSALSPRVAFLDHQRLLLNVDNSSLKQRIAALAQDTIFKDAHQEALKKEIERLRQIYHEQNQNKMANEASTEPPPPPAPLPTFTKIGCTDEE